MLSTRRAVLAGLAAAPFVRAAGTFRAGAATGNISPALGTSLAGYMTDRKCTEVHDELLVRCAAMESGSTRMLLATIDSCMVPRTVLDRVRARIAKENSVDPAFVLMSSTHTHSAPPAMHLFQSKPDAEYVAMLERRLGDAARMAFQRLRPARFGAGLGAEAALVNNRRYVMREGTVPADPFGGRTDRVMMNAPLQSADILRAAGPVDPAHLVIAALGEDGRPIWVYGNYALHYAGYNPATDASADYFGAWARRVEAVAGGGCVALLSNGCSGNINAVRYARDYPSRNEYTFIERVGTILALETMRVMRAMAFNDAVALGAMLEDVTVGTRRPSAAELQAAVKLVGDPPGDGYTGRPEIYARETVYVSQFPAEIRVPVQALRIGDVGMGTFPGETFVEFGLAVKKASGHKISAAVSIANDACGYIPTAEAYDEGGYETWRAKSAFVARETGERLAETVTRLLGRVG